jgi:hypothetical protein
MSHLFIKRSLVTAFVIETFCVTYALKFPAFVSIATVLYFLSGALIAVLLLFLPQATISFCCVKNKLFHLNAYRLLFMGIMGVMMFHFAAGWMADDPIVVKDADMLPVIRVMSQRFLHGSWKQVYDIIPEIWGGMTPIYLPAMWLPFSIPEALHIDVRWTTVVSLFFAFSVFIVFFKPYKNDISLLFLALAAFTLFWWLFTDETPGLVPYTEEGIVIAYYVLLVIALLSGNYWFIGIAISLCALSRYSFVGWLPAFLVYLLLQKQREKIGQLILIGITFLLLLLLLPFGYGVVRNTLQLPSAYISFAARVWNDDPEIFPEILGFSKFFGPNRIALQHQLLIVLSFTVPIIFIIFCWWMKEKLNKNIFNIPLASLKLTLVLFYSFIDVPYLYLFYTSSFVSLIAIAFFLKQQESSVKVYK